MLASFARGRTGPRAVARGATGWEAGRGRRGDQWTRERRGVSGAGRSGGRTREGRHDQLVPWSSPVRWVEEGRQSAAAPGRRQWHGGVSATVRQPGNQASCATRCRCSGATGGAGWRAAVQRTAGQCEIFEDGAVHSCATSASGIAAANQGSHAAFEGPELLQLPAQLHQMPGGHVAHLDAWPLRLVDEADQLAHLLDGEAEVAAAPDEGQATHGRVAVDPAATLSARACGQQADLFVVANGRDRTSGLLGDHADGQWQRGVHAKQLSPCSRGSRSSRGAISAGLDVPTNGLAPDAGFTGLQQNKRPGRHRLRAAKPGVAAPTRRRRGPAR